MKTDSLVLLVFSFQELGAISSFGCAFKFKFSHSVIRGKLFVLVPFGFFLSFRKFYFLFLARPGLFCCVRASHLEASLLAGYGLLGARAQQPQLRAERLHSL